MRERPLTRGLARFASVETQVDPPFANNWRQRTSEGSHLQNDKLAHDPVMTLTKEREPAGLRKKKGHFMYSCSRIK